MQRRKSAERMAEGSSQPSRRTIFAVGNRGEFDRWPGTCFPSSANLAGHDVSRTAPDVILKIRYAPSKVATIAERSRRGRAFTLTGKRNFCAAASSDIE